MEAEKLGTLASTLFHCENYTSPLHGDDDEIRGLCAQYFLDPSLPEDLHEYGFIYLKYGFYMVSRTNSLWCNLNYLSHSVALTPSIIPGLSMAMNHMDLCFLLLRLYVSVEVFPGAPMPLKKEEIWLLPEGVKLSEEHERNAMLTGIPKGQGLCESPW